MTPKIRYCRLATSQKIPDRFLTCQAYLPEETSQQEKGLLFSLVEILNPWFPTSQVGQTIINTAIRAYYSGESTSDLENFENALKKINETLAEIVGQGETDWIGNLNAILVLICNQQIHIVSTGRALAYLLREGRMEEIIETEEVIEPHPLKTFSAIASGTLKQKDRVFIASHTLLDFLSLSQIKDVGLFASPSQSVMEMAKLIKKTGGRNVNAILVELAEPEAPPEEIDTVYLDQGFTGGWQVFQRWGKRAAPALATGGQKIQHTGVTFWQFLSQRFFPAIGRILKTVFQKLYSWLQPYGQKLWQFISGSQPTPTPTQKQLENVQVYDYRSQKQVPAVQVSRFRFGGIFQKIFLYLRNRRRLLIIGAVLLLVILGVWIGVKKKQSSSFMKRSEAQQYLNDARGDLEKAKSAILFNENDKAKDLLLSSLSKSQILKNSIFQQEASDLEKDAQNKLDGLTSTIRTSPNVVASFPQALEIFYTEGYLYGLSLENKVYKANLTDGKIKEIGTIPLSAGKPQTGAWIAYNKSFFTYMDSKKAYQINTETDKIEVVSLKEGNLAWAQSTAVFFNNVYLLDPSANQIYKHTIGQDGTYSKGSSYIISAKIDIKNALSLAIDGKLYILRGDGTVTKLTKGKEVAFELKNVPTPFDKIYTPLKILTDPDATYIYILDGGGKTSSGYIISPRIIAYDKTGSYTKQYALPLEASKLKDIFINYKTNKAWVLAENKAYELELK